VQQLTAPWCPGHDAMQCLATFRLSTSPLHRHCYSSHQDELRARPVRTRIAGQVRVRAMQAGQTRSCGARTHTHKHPRTETRAHTHKHPCARAHTQAPAHRDVCGRLTRNLRSCPTLRLPPAPSSQHSFGQLKIVNRPTPQTSALFSGPHGLSASLGTS
jgi:hypothetical protein